MAEVISGLEKFNDVWLVDSAVLHWNINRVNLLVRDIFGRLEYWELVDLLADVREK